jgi:hypothetical protein
VIYADPVPTVKVTTRDHPGPKTTRNSSLALHVGI